MEYWMAQIILLRIKKNSLEHVYIYDIFMILNFYHVSLLEIETRNVLLSIPIFIVIFS